MYNLFTNIGRHELRREMRQRAERRRAKAKTERHAILAFGHVLASGTGFAARGLIASNTGGRVVYIHYANPTLSYYPGGFDVPPGKHDIPLPPGTHEVEIPRTVPGWGPDAGDDVYLLYDVSVGRWGTLVAPLVPEGVVLRETWLGSGIHPPPRTVTLPAR
jgi:hypothetical protein